ncbi:MAG TPA: tetratricopeptide repeat protein [Fimbriimonadaceae bacterium]|nr:tetratricopeptide repeat protein [Fimbriimonadaceae bacterium]
METLSFGELKENGQRLYQAQDYVGAAKHFRRATDLTPTSAEMWRLLGFSLTAAGEHLEAVTAFKSAIGLDPQNAEGFLGIGTAYAGTADYARAVSALDEALSIKPNMMAARNALINALIMQAKLLLSEDKTYDGEAALERAYRLDRTNPRTVLPYVQQLIVIGNHKKAFQIINTAKAESSHNAEIVALADRMDNDPKLAHAKQLQSVQNPRPALQAQRPTVNPDEVPCPCGAIRVMKWATVCPNCNHQIGDPSQRASRFAGHERLRGYSWQEVCYYILSVLWLIQGTTTFVLAYTGSSFFGGFFMFLGAANAGVALGMLFQVEWLQFVGKILMILNFLSGGWQFMSGVMLGFYLYALEGFFTAGIAGFYWYLINQMTD